MTTVKDMLRAGPADTEAIDGEALARCIQECEQCAQTCTACADACLSEEHVEELATCVRLDLDCADVCDITSRLLSRHTGGRSDLTRAQVQACALACAACATECERHAAMHEHCRLCAEACRACERACNDLLAAGL
ncbi:four-helix bundle copper-binding protein [Streptomyces sp. RFCAC02]|uniref:four-helix bundle copper-binding protein n=1 Tax=Streptomyces sp. RFCAC02 TaxID=2499143 RepID=UPI00101F77EF|nr:four-helix bundle copper-binding protein [Streptomyces sp. RFCAC02]